ncbi:Phytochrome-like protein cph2 [Aquicella siphonis]|uniref:Phytochrome-like protein cph2 n=1 Tax=Aquicella siphonis TaxID=254247 RepID=A0A5E4PGN6_9COXI|nr:EAL domain-containing protein [Aquicella siphonis]VVC76044.1 Phytochrome-like protein cph2 [Aquicella siphonis]
MTNPNYSEREQELLRAVHNQELVLYYQPQFNVATSTFEGIEALIRWRHPERGLLTPDQFIPFAEQSDLIIHIGEWALSQACKQFKIWQGKGLSPVRVAVNVSGRQFLQQNFVEVVFGILAEVKLDPACLELEISENTIIREDDRTLIEMIQRLNKAGILIALDDFGTGHSSVNYLQHIPVNRIKIDKLYIKNIHSNDADVTVVKSLIKLAQDMNLQVVAEGVETLIQLQTLLSQECQEIQGYYFSQPLPAEKVEQFLLEFHIIDKK